MIRSNELREGNKVISATHNLLNATVQNIMPHSGIVTLREVSTYDTFDKLDPIPLTPEWLERCGMELRDDDKVWQIQVGNSSYLEIEAEEPFMAGVTPETWRDQCPVYIWADVVYVHQLQNLYFALTGQKLIIKDT